MPIKTTREGEKITKVCVEDVNKILDRFLESYNKATDEIDKVVDSMYKELNEECCDYLVVGTGVSQPCGNDVFVEEIGNEIEFRKAKLNANVKKFRMILKLIKATHKPREVLIEELNKITSLIRMDCLALREYNPDYLSKTFNVHGVPEL